MGGLDPHGQPLVRRYSAARLSDRAVDELIGLSRGIVADAHVTQSEAEFLARWLDRNREAQETWPGNVLYERIREMLSDGVLDRDESQELLELLGSITGEAEPLALKAQSLSSSLPLTQPPPKIEFPDRLFCLTGRFVHGTRRECEAAVEQLGGRCGKSPTLQTHYLIIGHIGSTDWIHSTHGRKIEKAVEYAKRGASIQIVAEQDWVQQLAR